MILDSSRKKLKEGAIPSKNLPIKSIMSKQSSARSSHVVEKPANLILSSLSASTSSSPQKMSYVDFDDFIKKSKLLKSVGCSVDSSTQNILKLTKIDASFVVPKFEIIIDESIGFTVPVFGCFLPDTHALYKENLCYFFHVTTSSLMKHMESFKFCNGVVYVANPSPFLKKHIVYKVFNNADDNDQNDDPSLHSFHTTTANNNNIEYTRSINCSLLTQSNNICLFCKNHLSFDNNKSSGPNSIRTDVLKLIKNNICHPLKEIINLSFSTGIYPTQLKLAKVIPTFKNKR